MGVAGIIIAPASQVVVNACEAFLEKGSRVCVCVYTGTHMCVTPARSLLRIAHVSWIFAPPPAQLSTWHVLSGWVLLRTNQQLRLTGPRR